MATSSRTASKTSAPPIKTRYGFEIVASSPHAWLHALVSQLEARLPSDRWQYTIDPRRYKEATAILGADAKRLTVAAPSLVKRCVLLDEECYHERRRAANYANESRDLHLENCSHAIRFLLEKIVKPRNSWTLSSVEDLLKAVADPTANSSSAGHHCKRQILSICEELAKRETLSDPIRKFLLNLRPLKSKWGDSKEQRRTAARVDALLGKKAHTGWDAADPWAKSIKAELQRKAKDSKEAWNQLIEHAARASGTKPNKKWLTTAETLLRKLKPNDFADCISRWFPSVTPPPVKYRRGWENAKLLVRNDQPIRDRNAAILRGLAWCCGLRGDERLAAPLGDLALTCLKKYPGYVSFCALAGNACVDVLSKMSGDAPMAQLSRLKARL